MNELTDFTRLVQMLLKARKTFRVRCCIGEETPIWTIEVRGEAPESLVEFAFALDGTIQTIDVI